MIFQRGNFIEMVIFLGQGFIGIQFFQTAYQKLSPLQFSPKTYKKSFYSLKE